jgi:hypothetical protein
LLDFSRLWTIIIMFSASGCRTCKGLPLSPLGESAVFLCAVLRPPRALFDAFQGPIRVRNEGGHEAGFQRARQSDNDHVVAHDQRDRRTLSDAKDRIGSESGLGLLARLDFVQIAVNPPPHPRAVGQTEPIFLSLA